MKSKKKRALIILLIVVIFSVWMLWGNLTLQVTYVTVVADDLPFAFVGYRIAQVSDLHNAEFGKDNEKLLEVLDRAEPDMIALTGDLIDSSRTDVEIALEFVEGARLIAPCYYITGNHEAWVPKSVYSEMERQLVDMGVHVLHDEEVILEHGGAQIALLGIDDPDYAESHNGIGSSMLPEQIQALTTTEGFTILLSHRPEYFEQYVEADVDLVLAGHAHGGQFRLPLVGGLVAPNQGFFPEYDAGVFAEDHTTMVVSRGVGNSIIPIRFNNRPEVVIIDVIKE